MANILCLETTTTNCSVALSSAKGVAHWRQHRASGYSHAEKLHVLINEVLQAAKCRVSDLDAVAVCKGPGSYTGLRIGVSTAKGLAFPEQLPLISMTSTEVVFAGVRSDDVDHVVAMLDARRMEVFAQVFSEGKPSDDIVAQVIDAEAFSTLKGTVRFAGDGAEKCKEVLTDQRFDFVAHYPDARNMHDGVQLKYKQKAFEDLAYFEPFYLKEFIAGTPKQSPLGHLPLTS